MFGLPGLSVDDDGAAFEQDLRVAGDVERAVDFGVEIRNVQRRLEAVVRIIGIGAGDIGGERIARPIGAHVQFRRDDEIDRAGAAGRGLRIGIVAGRQFDRRQNQKRADLDAERLVRIAGGDRQRAVRHRSERQRIRRRRAGRRRAGGAEKIFGRRNRQDRAGPARRRGRIDHRRRIADRQFAGRRRQDRARPRRGLGRIDYGRRRRPAAPAASRRLAAAPARPASKVVSPGGARAAPSVGRLR